MACVNHHSYYHLLIIIKLLFHVILCVNTLHFLHNFPLPTITVGERLDKL